jgi:outer membrane protein OmpA-like peptidoglycan-associated protein
MDKPTEQEQEQKIVPVLTRLFDAAFRLGYYEFKKSAKFVLDTIKSKLGNDVADAITIDHLQGAYIGMAARYGDKATKKRDVESVETKEELEVQDVNDERGRGNLESDSSQVSTENQVGENNVQPRQQPTGTARGQGLHGSQEEGRPDSGGGLFGYEAPAPRERSNIKIQTGSTHVSSGSAGSRVDSGSSLFGIDGAPIEPESTEFVDELAESGLSLEQAQKQQLAAGKLDHHTGLENIRDTLPVLLPGQQEDLFKCCSRDPI